MEKVLIMSTPLFLSIAFLLWKFSNERFEEEYGTRMWRQWSTRLYYWQAILYITTLITVFLVVFLMWINIIAI